MCAAESLASLSGISPLLTYTGITTCCENTYFPLFSFVFILYYYIAASLLIRFVQANVKSMDLIRALFDIKQHRICCFSVITQVIIEIRALSLAENGVVFRFSIYHTSEQCFSRALIGSLGGDLTVLYLPPINRRERFLNFRPLFTLKITFWSANYTVSVITSEQCFSRALIGSLGGDQTVLFTSEQPAREIFKFSTAFHT